MGGEAKCRLRVSFANLGSGGTLLDTKDRTQVPILSSPPHFTKGAISTQHRGRCIADTSISCPLQENLFLANLARLHCNELFNQVLACATALWYIYQIFCSHNTLPNLLILSVDQRNRNED